MKRERRPRNESTALASLPEAAERFGGARHGSQNYFDLTAVSRAPAYSEFTRLMEPGPPKRSGQKRGTRFVLQGQTGETPLHS
jgi:hypothetical protein